MTLPSGKFVIWGAAIEALAAIVIAAVAIPSYLANKQAQAELTATVKAQEAVMKQRDQETAALVKQFSDLIASVKTPAQAVQSFPKVVELPKPIYIQPPVTQASNVPGSLPDAPSAAQPPSGSAVIPPESVVPLFQSLAKCKQDEANLDNCQKDREMYKEQRDQAMTVAKGGGFWRRAWHNSKWFLSGAAAGAITYAVAHH